MYYSELLGMPVFGEELEHITRGIAEQLRVPEPVLRGNRDGGIPKVLNPPVDE